MIEWQTNPPEESMTWDNAVEYAKSLDEGWRLPTRSELIDAYDKNLKGFIKDSYWSSNELIGYNTDAWYVNFKYGEVIDHDKTNNKYVRCVREVKGE